MSTDTNPVLSNNVKLLGGNNLYDALLGTNEPINATSVADAIKQSEAVIARWKTKLQPNDTRLTTLQAAVDIIKDPEMRAQYDELVRLGKADARFSDLPAKSTAATPEQLTKQRESVRKAFEQADQERAAAANSETQSTGTTAKEYPAAVTQNALKLKMTPEEALVGKFLTDTGEPIIENIRFQRPELVSEFLFSPASETQPAKFTFTGEDAVARAAKMQEFLSKEGIQSIAKTENGTTFVETLELPKEKIGMVNFRGEGHKVTENNLNTPKLDPAKVFAEQPAPKAPAMTIGKDAVAAEIRGLAEAYTKMQNAQESVSNPKGFKGELYTKADAITLTKDFETLSKQFTEKTGLTVKTDAVGTGGVKTLGISNGTDTIIPPTENLNSSSAGKLIDTAAEKLGFKETPAPKAQGGIVSRTVLPDAVSNLTPQQRADIFKLNEAYNQMQKGGSAAEYNALKATLKSDGIEVIAPKEGLSIRVKGGDPIVVSELLKPANAPAVSTEQQPSTSKPSAPTEQESFIRRPAGADRTMHRTVIEVDAKTAKIAVVRSSPEVQAKLLDQITNRLEKKIGLTKDQYSVSTDSAGNKIVEVDLTKLTDKQTVKVQETSHQYQRVHDMSLRARLQGEAKFLVKDAGWKEVKGAQAFGGKASDTMALELSPEAKAAGLTPERALEVLRDNKIDAQLNKTTGLIEVTAPDAVAKFNAARASVLAESVPNAPVRAGGAAAATTTEPVPTTTTEPVGTIKGAFNDINDGPTGPGGARLTSKEAMSSIGEDLGRSMKGEVTGPGVPKLNGVGFVGGGLGVLSGGLKVATGDTVEKVIGGGEILAGGAVAATSIARVATKMEPVLAKIPLVQNAGRLHIGSGYALLALAGTGIVYNASKKETTGEKIYSGATGLGSLGAAWGAGSYAAKLSHNGWVGLGVGTAVGLATNFLAEKGGEAIFAKGDKEKLQDAMRVLTDGRSDSKFTDADGQALEQKQFTSSKDIEEKAKAAATIAKITGNEDYAKLSQKLSNLAGLAQVRERDPNGSSVALANAPASASAAARMGAAYSPTESGIKYATQVAASGGDTGPLTISNAIQQNGGVPAPAGGPAQVQNSGMSV